MKSSVHFKMPIHAESLEGDEQGISERFGVSVHAIRHRVREIHLALAAASWIEYCTRRSLTAARPQDFRQAIDISESALFNEWNSSAFTFPEVVAMLGTLRNRL